MIKAMEREIRELRQTRGGSLFPGLTKSRDRGERCEQRLMGFDA